MMLVVDVNVVISSLVAKGVPFKVFLLNRLLRKLEFVAPDFLLTEFEKHKQRLQRESSLSMKDFNELANFLLEEISLIPVSQFSEFLPKAKSSLSTHTEDTPYLALALKLNCTIFSGDKKFSKLSPVKIFTPRQLLEKLLRDEE